MSDSSLQQRDQFGTGQRRIARNEARSGFVRESTVREPFHSVCGVWRVNNFGCAERWTEPVREIGSVGDSSITLAIMAPVSGLLCTLF